MRYLLKDASIEKRMIGQIVLIVLFFIGGVLINNSSLGKFNNINDYTTSTKKFDSVSVSEINTLKEKKNILLYTGRESCPYCYEFAPKLANAIKDSNFRIYYLDTEIKDHEFLDFADRYNIDSIPSFIYFKDGSVANRMDITNEMTIDEIRIFMDKLAKEGSHLSNEINEQNLVIVK